MRWLMRKRLVLGSVLAVMAFGMSQPAAAQSGGDISVGYSFLTNDQLAANATSLPAGWYLDTSLQLNDSVSLAFDVNGHYKRGIEASDVYSGGPTDPVVRPLPEQDFQAFSFNRPEDEFCSPVLELCEVHIQTAGVVGGPRFHFQAGGVRPYFHGLFGIARSLRKIGFFGHTATHLAIQPGGGVDIDITPNTAFRVQADYRLTLYPEPDQSDPGSQSSLVSVDGVDFKEFSFSFGVVVKLGDRRN